MEESSTDRTSSSSCVASLFWVGQPLKLYGNQMFAQLRMMNDPNHQIISTSLVNLSPRYMIQSIGCVLHRPAHKTPRLRVLETHSNFANVTENDQKSNILE